MPQKLYGRSAELRLLLDACTRVRRTGRPEVVAVSGYAGIGKSSLVGDLGRLAPAVDRALREMAARAERRRAEEALRASEARYALAVRGSSDGIWDWDVATGEVFYSARSEEMLGLREGELSRTLANLREALIFCMNDGATRKGGKGGGGEGGGGGKEALDGRNGA